MTTASTSIPTIVGPADKPLLRQRGKRSAAANTLSSVPAKPQSKAAVVLKLLSRAKGATIAEVTEPTGWQPHSTRAYLSGLRKKGMTIVREQRRSGETTYRIEAAGSAAPLTVSDVAGAEVADTADGAAADNGASVASAPTGNAAALAGA